MQVYMKIRDYIIQDKLNIDNVANKAGIPVNVFKAMLNGKRKIYSDEYKAICLALEVGAETFLDIRSA